MFDGWPRPSVRAPAPVTRFPGTVSGTCGIGSRSPWPPPFAPPPPPPVARPCSAASLLLWRSLTEALDYCQSDTDGTANIARTMAPDLDPGGFGNQPAGADQHGCQQVLDV